jgi:hypothetical protein
MRFRLLHKYFLILVIMLLTSVSFMGFAARPANAMVVSTNGIQGASIIDAPADITSSGATNLVIQAFNEASGVILGHDLAVDNGSISAGNVVDSHMIFLNSPEGISVSGGFTALGLISFTFSTAILGVMSDSKGLLEIASSYVPGTLTHYLGAEGTLYPVDWYYSRGMERTDLYEIAGNTIRLRMGVTSPGDWIRVVTAAPVPLPPSVWLFLGALGLTGLSRLRRATPPRPQA